VVRQRAAEEVASMTCSSFAAPGRRALSWTLLPCGGVTLRRHGGGERWGGCRLAAVPRSRPGSGAQKESGRIRRSDPVPSRLRRAADRVLRLLIRRRRRAGSGDLRRV
jgi:hypothetical protein